MCPEKEIIASFLYLQSLLNEDESPLILKEGDAEAISDSVLKIFSNFSQNIEKFENLENNNKNPFPMFMIGSKDNIGGINTIETSSKYMENFSSKDYKFELETSSDVVIDVDFIEIQDYNNVSNILDAESQKIILNGEENDTSYSLISSKDRAKNHFRDYFNNSEISERFGMGYSSSTAFVNKFVDFFGDFREQELIRIAGKGVVIGKYDTSKARVEFIEAILNENLYKNQLNFTNEKIEDIIEFIQEQMNKETKRSLVNIIERRTISKKQLQNYLFTNLWNGNKELIELVKASSTAFELNFKTADILNPLYNVSNKNDSKYIYAKVDIQRGFLNDSLDKKLSEKVIPDSITVNLTKPTITMRANFDENDEISPIRKSSQQLSKSYSYSSDYIEKSRKNTTLVDESDLGLKGNKSSVLSALSNESENTIPASGTVIDGTPDKYAYFEEYYSGDFTGDVADRARELLKEYGVFSIKSPSVKLLLSASLEHNEISEAIQRTFLSFKTKNISTNNFSSFVDSFTKNIIEIFESKGIYSEDFDFTEAVRSYSNLLRASKNLSLGGKSGYAILEEIIFSDRDNGRGMFLSKDAGIQSLNNFMKYINSGSGATLAIATRENLYGNKEKIHHLDIEQFYDKADSIRNRELSFDSIVQNNIISSLITNEYLKYYTIDNHIKSIYYLLSKNFEYFIDSITGKGAVERENFNIVNTSDISRDEFIRTISKSSKNSKDGVIDYYKEYLKNNKEKPDFKNKAEDEKENMKLIFDILLDGFNKYFIEKEIYEKNIEENFRFVQMELPEKFANLSSELFVKDITFEEAYPTETPYSDSIKFTLNAQFHKKEWEEFSDPIPFVYRLTDDTQLEVVEAFSSLGREKLIGDFIQKGVSPIIGSSRTLVTVFNVFDALAKAKDRDTSEPLLFLVVSSSNTKNYLQNIKEEYLEKHNIELKVLPSKEISNEVDKAVSQERHTMVFTNIVAGARGLDFSGLGEKLENGKKIGNIVFTGFSSPWSDEIQFAARANNPLVSEEVNIYFHNGGGDVNFAIPSKKADKNIEKVMKDFGEIIRGYSDNNIINFADDQEILQNALLEELNKTVGVKISYNDALAEMTRKNMEISKAFMSGEISDTRNTDTSNVVKLSNYLKESMEKGINMGMGRDI